MTHTILVMDVGNTNITLGIYRKNELTHHWRIATVRDRTADELGVLLKSLFRDVQFRPDTLDGVVISSVVPPLRTALVLMSQQYFGCTPLFVGPGMKTGLVIKYENARDVGADRIANAVAAVEMHGPPVIVVDFGTATTFTVLDEQGRYLGGVIAPGVQSSADALFQRTAKLPRIELSHPKQVVGRNTVTSMQSGLIYGFVGLVDGILGRIQSEVGLPFHVLATGGLAPLVAPLVDGVHDIEPCLTLEGLRILWERNR